MSPVIQVVRTYLELRSPEQLRRSYTDDPDVRFFHRDPCSIEHYRRLYHDVGEQWHWRDRILWSDERLAEHLASPNVKVIECMVEDSSAGYVELQRHDDGSVEIVYFGLVPGFMGRGLGAVLLTHAVEQAWSMGASRVWLHTCSLDSPRAIPNYKARGFEEFRTEHYTTDLPGCA